MNETLQDVTSSPAGRLAKKFGIILALALAVAGTMYVKGQRNQPASGISDPGAPSAVAAAEQASQTAAAVSDQAPKAAAPAQNPSLRGLPKLLELGSDKCIPCKKMAPILDDFRKNYAGRLAVEFIDVWKNQDAGSKYGIKLIPTQIFFDAEGKERFRHEGFYSKEDIINKWKEFGVDLSGNAAKGL